MRKISGDLGLMSLQELVAWAESRGKTGVLRICLRQVEKSFFLREGKMIFATSNRRGERFGEFLAARGCIDLDKIQSLIDESRRRGSRFTGDLLEEKVFERRELESALRELVVQALAEGLSWKEGSFEFVDHLPPGVLKGPITIEVSNPLGQALRLAVADTPGSRVVPLEELLSPEG